MRGYTPRNSIDDSFQDPADTVNDGGDCVADGTENRFNLCCKSERGSI